MADRERLLGLLHELEQADAQKSAQAEELHQLLEQVRLVRAKATEAQRAQSDLPARRAHAERLLGRARDEAQAARAALAEAEEAVRSAGKDEARAAELFEVRARDRLAIAERRRAEGEAELRAVDESGRTLEAVAARLEADGKSLASTLRNRPRVAEDAGVEPAPGLDGLQRWADAAHAALFVAQGQVDAEREAVIRQANEAGVAALGESLSSASAATIAQRVERALRDDEDET